MSAIGSSKALAGGATIDLRDNSGFGAAQGTLECNINDIKATGALLAGGKGASLWLSWNALGKHYNKLIQTAQSSRLASFSRHFSFIGGPSEITLTICSDKKGEGCGAQQRF
jgi:hypothetical protein